VSGRRRHRPRIALFAFGLAPVVGCGTILGIHDLDAGPGVDGGGQDGPVCPSGLGACSGNGVCDTALNTAENCGDCYALCLPPATCLLSGGRYACIAPDGSSGASSGSSSGSRTSSSSGSSGSSSGAGSGSGGACSSGSSSGSDASGPPGPDAAADGAEAGAGLPAPNLACVCPGPDAYDPNNAFAAAHPLTLDGLGRARVGGGVTMSLADFYSFTAPKHDPVQVITNYSVGAGNVSSLSLDIYDALQNDFANDHHPRSTPSDTLRATFESAAGAVYTARVSSSTDVCTAYDLVVDALYCTDAWEDNDSLAAPAPLALDATSQASILPTIDGLDDDYFGFAAPKHDPVSAGVTYTRPAGDTVRLQLEIFDSTGSDIAADRSTRTMPSQTLSSVWESASAGAVYTVHVQSDTGGVCAPYQLQLNGLWCTDSFEDNDSFATAVALPGNTQSSATVSSLDGDDYLVHTAAPTGSCTVSYTVPQGSTQQLQLDLYDATGSDFSSDHTARTSTSQTLTVSWGASSAPAVLGVTASIQDCTPYTVSCTP